MTTAPRLHSFCWVELATHDAEAAKKFYHGLFNWDFLDEPMPPEVGGNYITAMVGKDAAAAMFSITNEMKAMNVPPHWGSYVLVDNCDEAAKKAQSLGANILKAPFDCMEAGRMAILQDPCGAVVSLWQKNAVAGATTARDSHGAFCWQELMVADPKRALDFYTKLFGWSFDAQQFENTTYNSLKSAEGVPFGGIMSLPQEMPHIPPHWGVYFTVSKLKEAMSYVENNGGKILFGPQDVHGMGEFAICTDPQGASFAIFEFKI